MRYTALFILTLAFAACTGMEGDKTAERTMAEAAMSDSLSADSMPADNTAVGDTSKRSPVGE